MSRLSLAEPARVSAATRSVCTRVHAALPHRLVRLDRRGTASSSVFAAAWGDPPIAFYCGFARPGWYSPSNLVRVNGVDWTQRQAGSLVQWGSLLDGVFIELDVPTKYSAQAGYLVALARPLLSAGRVVGATPTG